LIILQAAQIPVVVVKVLHQPLIIIILLMEIPLILPIAVVIILIPLLQAT
jgi:hypothetical protein